MSEDTAESLAHAFYNFGLTVHTNSVPKQTDHVQIFTLALRWIDVCVCDHADCQSGEKSGTQWYPTRLLRVEPDNEMVFLQVTENRIPTGPYMTLSHCWGRAKPLTLTYSTFESLIQGLPLSRLPKTFSDALRITAALGAQYLWIDSLCIFQDSEEDWAKESATMGKVYSNSWCNIAASGSSDPYGGCFFTRNPLLVQPLIVDEINDGSFLILPKPHLIIDPYGWLRSLAHPNLVHRAWVVQERLLSPRQIYFGSEQIFWECRSLLACETFPNGLPELYLRLPPFTSQNQPEIKKLGKFTSGLLDLGQQLSAHSTISRTIGDMSADPGGAADASIEEPSSDTAKAVLWQAYRGWTTLIALYTRCQLTFTKDKLVALSGVAKQLQPVLNDQYLAGLWRVPLVSSLLWYTESTKQSDGRPLTRVRPLRAPTWSWASLDAAVGMASDPWPSEYTEDLIEIVEAGITPLRPEYPFGEVSGGYVRLRGHVYPAAVSEWATAEALHPWATPADLERWATESTLDSGKRRNYISCRFSHAPRASNAIPDARAYHLVEATPDEHGILDPGKRLELHCLPIQHTSIKFQEPIQGIDLDLSLTGILSGLIIQPIGESGNKFQRLGYFTHPVRNDVLASMLKAIRTSMRAADGEDFKFERGGCEIVLG